MSHRYTLFRCLRLSCCHFGLALLLSSINLESVRAQTIDLAQDFSIDDAIAQVPDLTSPQDTQPLPRIPAPQDVQPIPEEPLETPKPAPLPPPEELLQPPSPTQPTPEPTVPGKVPDTFTVKRFEVEGSTVFSREELEKVLAPYTNRPLSFAELLQSRSAVTQLYVDQGYITTGALIPPQTLQDGVVRIQVVEGSLEEINVTGTRRLKPSYIRARIPQATPLNQQRLLEALQLLQLNPLIQNLSAELSAGSRPGTNVLDIEVTEAETFDLQVVLDNRRTPSVGSFRRRAQLSEANLLGLGDGISVAYSNTDGSDGIDASYTIPINPRDGTLSFNYGTTDSEVIEEPFDALNIEGDSSYYELTFRQPIVRTPNQELALGLTAARRESDISSEIFVGTLEGDIVRLPPDLLSPGADSDGNTRVSALQFFQEWTTTNSREVIAARSQFSFGLGAFNATVDDNGPDSQFFAWRGQAQWVRLLAPETLFLLRTDIQLANDALVPLEQFGLGGLESVRGYRQDALLTDNGVFASAELRVPIYRSPQRQTILQVTPFVDFGTAWDNSGREEETNTAEEDTLVSVGLGLRLQLGDRLTARIDWGIPLVDIPSSDRTWQENGVYFSIVASPF